MPETPAFPLTLGGVDARWIGGALWLSAGHGGLLIDAPAGVHAALAATGLLGSLQAVLVSSARTRAVSGLIGLWDALGGSTRRSLRTMYVLGDERTPLLAQAWSQGWPDHVRLDVDGLAPGSFTDAVGLDIELVPLRIGEPGPFPGLSEGIRGMLLGEERALSVPAQLAYPILRPGQAEPQPEPLEVQVTLVRLLPAGPSEP